MVNPFRSLEETKKYHSKYYEANKDKLKIYSKEQRMKKYDDYRTTSLEYKKTHKKELAEQQLQSHMCVCGITYTQCNRKRHQRTLRHIRFIEETKKLDDKT